MKDSKSFQPPTSNSRPLPLTRIVPWSQQLVCEVLLPGDLAIDLTAGKGRDTFALVQAVGETGRVVAFDIQEAALDQTEAFLKSHGVESKRCSQDQPLPAQPGIYLVESCHSHLQSLLHSPVKAVMANLGYLPGGDQSLITRPDSTLSALQQSLDLLACGGRLAVTVYPSHPGGADEGDLVRGFFHDLPREKWQVLSLCAANRPEAPYLLVAERTS